MSKKNVRWVDKRELETGRMVANDAAARINGVIIPILDFCGIEKTEESLKEYHKNTTRSDYVAIGNVYREKNVEEVRQTLGNAVEYIRESIETEATEKLSAFIEQLQANKVYYRQSIQVSGYLRDIRFDEVESAIKYNGQEMYVDESELERIYTRTLPDEDVALYNKQVAAADALNEFFGGAKRQDIFLSAFIIGEDGKYHANVNFRYNLLK